MSEEQNPSNNTQVFDFTITREDTNRAALRYWRPIILAYIQKHATPHQLNIAAYFLLGFLSGSLEKLGVRDVIELRSLWPGVDRFSFDDAYGTHLDFLEEDEQHPGLFEGVAGDFYLERWASLWIDVHNEIYVCQKRGLTLPSKTAAYYLGNLYAEVQLEIMPPVIAARLEALLSDYVIIDQSLRDDLKLDRTILRTIPKEKVPYSRLPREEQS